MAYFSTIALQRMDGEEDADMEIARAKRGLKSSARFVDTRETVECPECVTGVN